MNFIYKLNKILLGRNAAQLVAQLQPIHASISIYKKDSQTCINAKSLVGLLSGHYMQGDVITIHIDEIEEASRVKEVFNEYGNEI